ncbi:transposase [Flavobacterium collinsii]|uniref:site-specific integrase n=1 Tax=Flavobacterium collinsii TaxID=1114861 RepID=UPI0022CA59A4|nr:site-specific integrase [Flavobacterium collinsii]GIQ61248.1 transposase [Flavobacterium collinsii]
MKAKVNLHFYAKSTKANTKGQFPIYVRLTVNGIRTEFSTKKFIEPNRWLSEAGKIKGTTEEARSINGYLDVIKSKVLDIQMELIHKNQELNIENLKELLFGSDKKQRTLAPIFQDHNNKIKELVGKEYAPGTLERYTTSLKHTIEFLEWKYSISDIEISKINHAFITDYEFYLRSVRNCANNTAVKYIKNFSKIIKICLANDWLEKNPFANYKAKVKEVERVYLTEEEVQSIIEKDLKNDRLSHVRDIFLFSCFTGLAYIDVKNLTKSHISMGIDGEKWIFTHRQKTESASKIPILPVTQIIIDKYENHPQCISSDKLLPILSNQKMNAYLKEIAGICEIDKELTFHIARHTFATTVTLTNGVPIESVSKNARA